MAGSASQPTGMRTRDSVSSAHSCVPVRDAPAGRGPRETSSLADLASVLSGCWRPTTRDIPRPLHEAGPIPKNPRGIGSGFGSLPEGAGVLRSRMLFASFDFLLFLCVVFAGYWRLSAHPGGRSILLLSASYFFYMAAPKPPDGPLPTPWYYVGLLLFSTAADYVLGLKIAAAQKRASSPPDPVATAKPGLRPGFVWVAVSLVVNLGLLGYYKYTGFLLEIASDLAVLFGAAGRTRVAVEQLLPVGISFYTFQSLSYTIDVYRGRIPVERSLRRFALFVAFFPQLVAGPIVRASELLPQLDTRPRLSRADVDFAIFRIVKGLLKKVVLGDFIAVFLADQVFASPQDYSSLENLLALYAFTLQIYADFSGYSDIAIGTARLFGIRIPENFDRPYRAVDVGDFWRRWHITLSSWLRDYVYYPLGGNRVGVVRHYLNLWVTMFVVGIWHGASWNFVCYACLQATAMVFSRFCNRRVQHGTERLLRLTAVAVGIGILTSFLAWAGLRLAEPWRLGLVGGGFALLIGLLPNVDEKPGFRWVHILLTLHFSVLSRLFFRSESLESARLMANQLVNWDGRGVRDGLFRIELFSRWIAENPGFGFLRPLADWGIFLLLLGGFAVHYTPSRWLEIGEKRTIPGLPAILLGACLATLFGFLGLLLAGPRANIYFNF